MRHQINTLLKTQKQLMKYFNCPNEYFIKPLADTPWEIVGSEDMKILTYEHNNTTYNAVIVRNNGKYMIYRSRGYVCVVAIDCVKIAFIFDESREMNL
jgi:hypothetical protein